MTRVDGIEHEKLMYEIIGNISESNAPIIFKGALITKLILAENHFNEIARKTIDIDANWIGEPPDMKYLEDIVNQSLTGVSVDLYAKIIREYGNKKSAGICIFDSITDEPVVEMDISISKFQNARTYTYGEMTIKGILPTEILADKISVISGDKIFRRAKDLVDIYALAHCVEVKTTDIYASHERNGRTLSDFTTFIQRVNDLDHAYQKLRGIDNKPEFENVYRYVAKFAKPFMLINRTEKIWNCKNAEWDEIKKKEHEESVPEFSIAEQIQYYQKKVDEHDKIIKRNPLKNNNEPEI